MKLDETTIAIMQEHVSARHERVAIHELQFLPDNPRVYAAIREMSDFDGLTPEEKQTRIYERLLQEPSVKKLIPEIERDGGLQDPITVRWDRRQVIEGNSRLAVYRKLWKETRDEQWAYIRCLVVTDLTDDQQTRLLAQTHLHGKTEWSPYARALFCFRWVEDDKKDIATLARISGLTANEIKKNVKVIQLMKDNNDAKLSNFSYYNDVLVRNRVISSTINNRRTLKDRLLTEIKEETFTAQEMRKWVSAVIAKPRILKKYEKGSCALDDAYDRAKISGTQQRLKKVRDRLEDIEKRDIDGLERNELRAVQQVLRQIRRKVKRVSDMIENRTATT
ncbi:hypothetical protein [Candidatus Palauibacter sp.]|uniref:hypothetical protein n=1 Tax=Candidatus Palauibacter sp. TaxID=3101350 RepID=UPI003B5CBE6C